MTFQRLELPGIRALVTRVGWGTRWGTVVSLRTNLRVKRAGIPEEWFYVHFFRLPLVVFIHFTSRHCVKRAMHAARFRLSVCSATDGDQIIEFCGTL